MKKYLERLRNEKTPHERRAFAMRVASVVTALFFVVWITTLGVRLAQHNEDVAKNQANLQSTASTLQAVQAASSTLGY
jgi:hypothetical protein